MPCPNISYLRARDPSILACGYPGRNIKSNQADQLVESIFETDPITTKTDDHLQVYLRLKKIKDIKDLYDINDNDNSLLCKVPEGAQCIRNVRDGTSVTKIFKFSKIFGPESKQADLFNNIIKEKVLQFINGFNCSLLTYGASGSGKTYTIVGTANEPGIIPRALEYLFRTLPQLSEEPQIKPAASGKIIKLSDSEKKLEKTASDTLLNNSTTNIDFTQHTRTYKTMQQRLSNEPVAVIADDITDVSLGKTYTIVGTANEPGIIPRALEYLFRTLPQLSEEPQIKPAASGKIIKLSDSEKKLEKTASDTLLNNSTTNIDFTQHTRTYKTMQQRLSNEPVAVIADDITDVSLGVWVSFAEIYNENVYDLLTPQPLRGQSRQKLRLGHCDGNAYIKDLKYINVTSGLQAYHLMQFGLQNLKYAATCVNEHSSRSHSIFTIKLAQASDTKEGVSVSSFNFCDLAGSERLNKTHNVGQRLKESNNINTSLLVLGRCVSSIRNAQKSNSNKLIPFRESKLTQLFQRALLGHEAISMIVNINPTRQMFDESQHVLNFSAIAKDVAIEQQQLIQRPRNNRFSQYMEGRSTALPTVEEEAENTETVANLQTHIANLVEQIQQQQLDAKENREYIITEYKKLLEETSDYWKNRYQELEEKLSNKKAVLLEQQSRKRKHSVVVVLDSSSEGDENLEMAESKNRKRQRCDSREQFISGQKELTETKLQLQTGEIQVQKLTEENKLLEKTLQDAVKAYKDLELQYDSSMKELKKRVVQQQDEINILTTYCENCHSPSESVSSDNVSVSLPPSEIDLEEQMSVDLNILEGDVFEETAL